MLKKPRQKLRRKRQQRKRQP
ncbi:hypothetical protein, partial [Escherichia coli]